MVAPSSIDNSFPGAAGTPGAQGPQGISIPGMQGPQGSPAGAVGSQGNVLTGVAFSTLGQNYLFSAVPGAGDWMFWFFPQFSDGSGNTSVITVSVNGVPIAGYAVSSTPSLSTPPIERLSFVGKVTLGPLDVLTLEGSPPAGPGFAMDSGYYGLLQVG